MHLANRIFAPSILVIMILVFSNVLHLDKEVKEVEVEVEVGWRWRCRGGGVREKGSERRKGRRVGDLSLKMEDLPG